MLYWLAVQAPEPTLSNLLNSEPFATRMGRIVYIAAISGVRFTGAFYHDSRHLGCRRNRLFLPQYSHSVLFRTILR